MRFVRPRSFCRLSFIAIFFSFGAAFAEKPCGGASAQEILECALRRHPDVAVSVSEALRDEKLIEIAKQVPNPAFDTRLLGGTNDDALFNTEDTLLFNVELGGKRRARVGQAKSEADKSQIQVRKSVETIALQTVLALYRLRQIGGELALASEAIQTYDRIIGNFGARPKLTPEQDASKTTFELAKQDFRMRRTLLIQEQTNLSRLLELATDIPYESIKKCLPGPKRQWPKLEPGGGQGTADNAAIAEARIEQSLAEKKFDVAKAKSWPDLYIGPTFDTETSSDATRFTGGVGLAIELPMLNRNQGEKAFAAADRVRADTQLKAVERKAGVERAIQVRRYEAATQALGESQSPQSLSVQHQKVESFYERGLVPSTLVIEAHEQWFEVTRMRHEQELTGIEAFWRVQILDGKLEETKI